MKASKFYRSTSLERESMQMMLENKVMKYVGRAPKLFGGGSLWMLRMYDATCKRGFARNEGAGCSNVQESCKKMG